MALFRRFSTHRRVERLIREGVGVREASWRLHDGQLPETTEALVDDVVAWVRASMSGMRRPYGIDHIAVAFAARDWSGKVICSSSPGVLRPGSFYGEEGAEHVRAFLGDARRAMDGGGGEVVGALLSLGDIAYELNARAA
jgi:hypothetical protein